MDASLLRIGCCVWRIELIKANCYGLVVNVPQRAEKTTDLPHPGQAHKVVTKTLIVDIDTGVKMNH